MRNWKIKWFEKCFLLFLGKGALYILSYNIQGTELKIVHQYDENDVITDISWNPNDNSMVTACGNGTVSIFNSDRKYITILAHKKEVSSVHWKESILTSGWDSTLKIVIIKRFSMYVYVFAFA